MAILKIRDESGNFVEMPVLQGPQGIQGPQGEQGVQGIQGPKGETGATGQQGPKGDKGDTGSTGPKGDTGSQGPKGDKGDKGDTGSTGPQGPEGPEGPQGPAGADGKTPVKGTDYYTAADKEEMVTSVINSLPTNIIKLWENQNKNAAFVGQDVTLSSGNYDYLIVTYKFYYTNDNNYGSYLSQFVSKGTGFKLIDVGNFGVAGNYNNCACYSRSVTRTNDTTFKFQGTIIFCSMSPYYSENANNYLIPIAIYGGKF